MTRSPAASQTSSPPHSLLLFPILSHGPPDCSSNTSGRHLPRGLCTCSLSVCALFPQICILHDAVCSNMSLSERSSLSTLLKSIAFASSHCPISLCPLTLLHLSSQYLSHPDVLYIYFFISVTVILLPLEHKLLENRYLALLTAITPWSRAAPNLQVSKFVEYLLSKYSTKVVTFELMVLPPKLHVSKLRDKEVK